MELAYTKISQAGSFRCCLQTIGHEYYGRTVEIGDKSFCKLCEQEYELVKSKKKAVWKPNINLGKV